MKTFVKEIKEHLLQGLIPFWERMKDEKYGGYYGYMDYDLNIDQGFDKGCILNSRILWFFSNAYLILKDEKLLADAAHAFSFLKTYCMDETYGGIYWSVSCDGSIVDDTKHTYNQAFAIYALSSWYHASGDITALNMAFQLFDLIEAKCKDAWGYQESFDRDFSPVENKKLSENGVIAEKTMNTHLHVLEAYTELFRVSKQEKVAKQIRYLFDLIAEHIYNPEKGRQEVFFDGQFHPLIDLYSYGHDIEAAWLMERGLTILDDKSYEKKILPITTQITRNIYQRAYKEHSLLNEAENGMDDMTKVWWVQAEAVTGFVNGWMKDREQKEYLEAAQDIWSYIRDHFVDKRQGSEWFWALDASNQPLHKPIVEPWKCPYHNGRMCLEVIRRMDDDT